MGLDITRGKKMTTNNPTLYFLRSSEQHIINKMLPIAFCLKEEVIVENSSPLNIYKNFYGLSTKDLGLYALVDNEISGAVWIRLLQNSEFPILNIAVIPKYRNKGIATAMLNQLLLEAGTVFKNIAVKIHNDKKLISFYENFGFTKLNNSSEKSLISDKDILTMTKVLEQKEVLRPSDGYDPRRWMD